jgi:hypothetical protein
MDPQEALGALGLMQSSSHRRDNEFYRLASEWLRLGALKPIDEKKYRADLEKWHDEAIEYLVKMNLEAIERGLIPNPLAPILKNQKSSLKKSQQSAFRKIINCLLQHRGVTALRR